jgi:hypothetical protein
MPLKYFGTGFKSLTNDAEREPHKGASGSDAAAEQSIKGRCDELHCRARAAGSKPLRLRV